MKLIVTSDLHLDTSFSGNGFKPNVGRKLRYSLQQTLLNVVELVKTSGAEGLLCGGNLYEHDRFSPETAALLRYAFAEIAPTPVYVAPGNQDWYGPESLYRQVEWTPNVHIFNSDQLSPVTIQDGLTLWGAAHCAPEGSHNFLQGFHTDRGGVHIGLFHNPDTDSAAKQADSAGGPGPRPFDPLDIENAGLHHLFLGDYHEPREAARYTYPGNPHPLSWGQNGDRGAVIATITSDGNVEREWRCVAHFPFHDLDIDLTGCMSRGEIREKLEQEVADLSGVARVTLRGDIPAELEFHPKDLSDIKHPMEGLLVRIGRLRPKYDYDVIATEPTVRGQFVRDVLKADMDAGKRSRVLMTGLRALEGRRDLEVF
jgi:DNA repair exonuclease SbcCD nuclease subunit